MDRATVKRIFEKERIKVMSRDDEVIFDALIAYRDQLIMGEYTAEVRYKLCILNERIFQMTKNL
jgi:hypothetical protein